jgi:hypothetical protein
VNEITDHLINYWVRKAKSTVLHYLLQFTYQGTNSNTNLKAQ